MTQTPEETARWIAKKLWDASGICNDTPHGMIRDYIARGIMMYIEQANAAPSVDVEQRALTHILLLDQPYSAIDVLSKLIKASMHLLHGDDYDGGDYEEISACVKYAEEITARTKAYLAGSRDLGQMEQWVSVEDQLPRHGVEVIAGNVETKANFAARYDKISKDWYVFTHIGRDRSYGVTHWRELPSPPIK